MPRSLAGEPATEGHPVCARGVRRDARAPRLRPRKPEPRGHPGLPPGRVPRTIRRSRTRGSLPTCGMDSALSVSVVIAIELTEPGQRLVETGDPDLLRDDLLTKVLGPDHVIVELADGVRDQGDLVAVLQRANPGWGKSRLRAGVPTKLAPLAGRRSQAGRRKARAHRAGPALA